MDFLRRSVRWIRALARWFMQARRLWRPVAVVLGILVVSSLLPVDREDGVRYSGLLLELLGISAVVLGITSRRRLFNRPSLCQQIGAWLNNRPRWGVTRQTILVAEPASLTLSGSAELSTWRSAGADGSVEARLAAAEANLVNLRTELEEVSEDLRAETRQRVEAVVAERQAREAAAGELRTSTRATWR